MRSKWIFENFAEELEALIFKAKPGRKDQERAFVLIMRYTGLGIVAIVSFRTPANFSSSTDQFDSSPEAA